MESTKSTAQSLQRYISYIESRNFLMDHEVIFNEYGRNVEKKAAKLKPPLNEISKRLYKIAENTAFCINLYNYKFYLLAKSIVHALETENPLSLANNTRSLLEQVAVLHHCTSNINLMLKNLTDQGTPKKINEILSKAETILERTYSGQGSKKVQPEEIEAIHAHTAIKSLVNEISNAETLYNYLCEFVHPNLGNNLLISSGSIGKGRIERKTNSSEVIQNISNISQELFDNIYSMNLNRLSIAARTSNLVEICFQKGAKVTNIFSTKKPTPTGDGKSKETAYYFANARTAQEALELCKNFLTQNGHSIESMKKSHDGFIGSHAYDIWENSREKIWFKISLNINSSAI